MTYSKCDVIPVYYVYALYYYVLYTRVASQIYETIVNIILVFRIRKRKIKQNRNYKIYNYNRIQSEWVPVRSRILERKGPNENRSRHFSTSNF